MDPIFDPYCPGTKQGFEPGSLGEKHECYLSAMQPPLNIGWLLKVRQQKGNLKRIVSLFLVPKPKFGKCLSVEMVPDLFNKSL